MSPEKLAKNNFFFMFLEGMLFHVAYSLLQTDTVIARFIEYSAHSTTLIGLAATIGSIAFLIGQVIGGTYIHRIRMQSKHMLLMAFISRTFMLVMAAALMLGLRGVASAWLFLLLYGGFLLMDGMVALCWTQVQARTVPLKQRGEIAGLQQTVSGILGLFTGAFLQHIFNSTLNPYMQFTVVFATAGTILLISVIAMSRIGDIPHPSHPEQPVKSLIGYLKELVPLFGSHRGMRQVAYSRCLYTLTMMAVPLNYTFGMLNGLSEYQLTLLVYMPIAGKIVSGILWAQLSRHTSYPIMMLTAQLLGLLSAIFNIIAFAMAAAGQSVMIPLSIAMILLSINSSGGNAHTQHMIAIVDEENRASFIVLLALVAAPFSFSSTLAGLIADTVGYLPVYIIVVIAAIVGLVQTFHFFFSDRSPLPKEQRHGAQE